MERQDKIEIRNFYLKIFFLSLGLCCIVWSFLLLQFWWGNHDWGYLKSGTDIVSGLFEARYSQHLPTFLLLDGHLLPFFTVFCALVGFVLEAMLIAVYLDIPKTVKNYLFLIFLLCLNPYTATLFYFLHYVFPLVFWSCMGIVLLFVAEKAYRWYNVLLGSIVFFLILGSYPPNIALVLVLFVTKRLFQYLNDKENIKNIVCRSLFLGVMLILGYIGFGIVYDYILQKGFINLDMYNIAIRSVFDAGKALWAELGGSVIQLFHQHSFMRFCYCFLLFILILAAVLAILAYKKNKVLLGLFIVAILLASRVCFIVGADVSAGVFRMEYWSRLALEVFALAVLLKSDNKFITNFLLAWGIWALVIFIGADLDIQKTRYLEFAANRKYQARRIEDIVTQPRFEMVPKYISLNLGYPTFYPKYMEAQNRSGDIAGVAPVFDFDGVNQLFWEEKQSPIVIGASVWGSDNIFKANRGDGEKWENVDYWKNNPKNMENIRYWLYTDAKYNRAYVDDKYIITIFDVGYFYKYREMIANNLDK